MGMGDFIIGGETMTIEEFKKEFYPKYNSAFCAVKNMNHAVDKCNEPENVRYQLSCSGWNKDTEDFLIEALKYYRESTINKIIKQSVGCFHD